MPKLREKALAFAISKLGTKEATGHNDGPEVNEFQRAVGEWAVNKAWCASFVTWSYKKAAKELGLSVPFKGQASVLFLANDAKTNGTYKAATKTFIPEPGNIFLVLNPDADKNHTGIVWEVKGNMFKTIEGNIQNKVTTRWLPLFGGEVKGYIQVKEG